MAARLLAVSSSSRSVSAIRATVTAGIFQPRTQTQTLEKIIHTESPFSLTFFRLFKSSSPVSCPQLDAASTSTLGKPPPLNIAKMMMRKQHKQKQPQQAIEFWEPEAEENKEIAVMMKTTMQEQHQQLTMEIKESQEEDDIETKVKNTKKKRKRKQPQQHDAISEITESEEEENNKKIGSEMTDNSISSSPSPPLILNPNDEFRWEEKDLESEDSIRKLYDRWLIYHGLSRTEAERPTRIKIFTDSAKDIIRHNKMRTDPDDCWLGLTRFCDCDPDEGYPYFRVEDDSTPRRLKTYLYQRALDVSFVRDENGKLRFRLVCHIEDCGDHCGCGKYPDKCFFEYWPNPRPAYSTTSPACSFREVPSREKGIGLCPSDSGH